MVISTITLKARVSYLNQINPKRLFHLIQNIDRKKFISILWIQPWFLTQFIKYKIQVGPVHYNFFDMEAIIKKVSMLNLLFYNKGTLNSIIEVLFIVATVAKMPNLWVET